MAEDRGSTQFSIARAGRCSLRAIVAVASVAHKSSGDGFALKLLDRDVAIVAVEEKGCGNPPCPRGAQSSGGQSIEHFDVPIIFTAGKHAVTDPELTFGPS